MCSIYLSECCGYTPLYSLDDSGCDVIGICSKCKDHTTFKKEI